MSLGVAQRLGRQVVSGRELTHTSQSSCFYQILEANAQVVPVAYSFQLFIPKELAKLGV